MAPLSNKQGPLTAASLALHTINFTSLRHPFIAEESKRGEKMDMRHSNLILVDCNRDSYATQYRHKILQVSVKQVQHDARMQI